MFNLLLLKIFISEAEHHCQKKIMVKIFMLSIVLLSNMEICDQTDQLIIYNKLKCPGPQMDMMLLLISLWEPDCCCCCYFSYLCSRIFLIVDSSNLQSCESTKCDTKCHLLTTD